MDPSKVVLTKEQAELLLPLLPALQQTPTTEDNGCKFTTSQMFSKERPGGKSTAAQNYLLVSFFLAVSSLAARECLLPMFTTSYCLPSKLFSDYYQGSCKGC